MFLQYLRTWGEMGIVANHEDKKIRSKLADRGRPMMFVGYATDHAGDVYRMCVRKSLRLKVTVAKACLLYRLLIIVVLVRIMNLHQRIILIG